MNPGQFSKFLIIKEPSHAKIHTIQLFECRSTNHLKAKKASPIPRLGQNSASSAYAGSAPIGLAGHVSGSNETYSPFCCHIIKKSIECLAGYGTLPAYARRSKKNPAAIVEWNFQT